MNTPIEFTQRYEFKRNIDWPVDIGIAAGIIIAFAAAWIGLVCVLYLEHWMAGVLGAVAGGLVGWIWFKMRRKYGR